RLGDSSVLSEFSAEIRLPDQAVAGARAIQWLNRASHDVGAAVGKRAGQATNSRAAPGCDGGASADQRNDGIDQAGAAFAPQSALQRDADCGVDVGARRAG